MDVDSDDKDLERRSHNHIKKNAKVVCIKKMSDEEF